MAIGNLQNLASAQRHFHLIDEGVGIRRRNAIVRNLVRALGSVEVEAVAHSTTYDFDGRHQDVLSRSNFNCDRSTSELQRRSAYRQHSPTRNEIPIRTASAKALHPVASVNAAQKALSFSRIVDGTMERQAKLMTLNSFSEAPWRVEGCNRAHA